MRLEAVVVPDGELQRLAGQLLACEVHEHERLMPLRFTRALHVAGTTLVVRTAAHNDYYTCAVFIL